MDKEKAYREIPYNYTSFTDRDIILRYFDEEIWNTLNELRAQRVTGRSAKLMFEIMGDIFIIERNPYIFSSFLENTGKIRALHRHHQKKIAGIEAAAGDNQKVLALAGRLREEDRKFFRIFHEEKRNRLRILHGFHSATDPENVRFDALSRVSHVTDASDWRVEYPEVVVYPSSAEEIPGIIAEAKRLGLKIIPFGGGTGTTGGVASVYPDTAVVNLEKLTRIGKIETVNESGTERPVIEVEAGVITDHVINYCKKEGYIFATDPTSSWASTIGGNIAENAGGKKCVMWGTAIDNIYSFRIINAASECLEVRRRNHPWRKIEPSDDVIFDVYRITKDKNAKNEKGDFIRSIILKGTDLRKPGVGKDVTNKALGGVPGLQKEGGDGIIISAKFVLYKPFKYKDTLCLEFFGSNLVKASTGIVEILDAFKKNDRSYLTALEHLDDKYATAIKYKNKSDRSQLPKAVIIVDVESNDEEDLKKSSALILSIVKKYDAEGFKAKDAAQRTAFWNERKHLGAIAKHTNSFKLNEDIVIPIAALPEFSDFVESVNIQKNMENYISLIDQVTEFLSGKKDDADKFLKTKIAAFKKELAGVRKDLAKYRSGMDKPAADFFGRGYARKSVFEVLRDEQIPEELEKKEMESFRLMFRGYDDILAGAGEIFRFRRSRKIIVATHMHAGDGNIHVNLPVHSSDPEMMAEAHEIVAKVMKKTVAVGGVITGEHGIGLTKLKFADKKILEAYADYKKEADPDDLFNPGKLTVDFPYNRVYTPSMSLLKKEAFILEAAGLSDLISSVSSCVRCGKCKDVCNTHFPEGNMFFSPRNKIFGISLVTEAVLYEAQTGSDLSFSSFELLKDISGHCTGCHKCKTPCSVDIDFGEVSMAVKALLKDKKEAGRKPVTHMALLYLRQKGIKMNHLLRILFFRTGYRLQALGYFLNRPFSSFTAKVMPFIGAMLSSKLPGNAGTKSLREYFGLNETGIFYAFRKKNAVPAESVVYFPGCGSERTFPDISMAVMALLYNAGYRVVIAPEYLCCGYPFLSNGDTETAEKISYENRVIFHRMADTIRYMNIAHVVISCGTCLEMLSHYELDRIFPGAGLIDCSELIAEKGLYPVKEEKFIYHDPCHSPLKKSGPAETFKKLFGAAPKTVDRCCGEGGTLALSTPDISRDLRKQKIGKIEGVTGPGSVTVLTTCPSCVQGLSKINENISVTGKHLAVQLAELHLGKNWKSDFIKAVQSEEGIEKIFL